VCFGSFVVSPVEQMRVNLETVPRTARPDEKGRKGLTRGLKSGKLPPCIL
jgi:hypothetical protein